MNLVQKSVSHGGKLAPIVLPEGYYKDIGYMNPSIFIDDDGEILMNLRHINYTLYHSEHNQKFLSNWGPLAYLHPENDLALRTINYMCRLDENLNLVNYTQVEMQELHTPIWEFTGLEDARLVKWEDKYYLIGVRRDTNTTGQGRMEYTQIDLDKTNWTAKETFRKRIPAPLPDTSYCEKNWEPVLDRPYEFVKWTLPTEVVKALPDSEVTEQVVLKNNVLPIPDQRGGSHVVPWGNYYLSITHEVNLYKNYLGQKDGIYRHRFVIWDREFNLVGVSPEPFTFLDAKIEFCAGAAVYKGDLLISFGFQDNCAYVLRTPGSLIDELIEEAMNVR